ncbi:hypothetical protein D3C78_1393730 [compost metagenome]
MRISMSTTSTGFCCAMAAASYPLPQTPTTSRLPSKSKITFMLSRINGSSSTINTRIICKDSPSYKLLLMALEPSSGNVVVMQKRSSVRHSRRPPINAMRSFMPLMPSPASTGLLGSDPLFAIVSATWSVSNSSTTWTLLACPCLTAFVIAS